MLLLDVVEFVKFVAIDLVSLTRNVSPTAVGETAVTSMLGKKCEQRVEVLPEEAKTITSVDLPALLLSYISHASPGHSPVATSSG